LQPPPSSDSSLLEHAENATDIVNASMSAASSALNLEIVISFFSLFALLFWPNSRMFIFARISDVLVTYCHVEFRQRWEAVE
jgi:ABC-type multidrug transport system fused ATPase/permease subunit